MIKLVGSTPLPTEFGNWTYMVFREEPSAKLHTLMVCKRPDDIKQNPDKVLVRVHSSCVSSELFHASNCECREELDEAMRRIAKEGRGVLVYLEQEAAGNGIKAKLDAMSLFFEWQGDEIVARKDSDTGKEMNIYDAYEKLGYNSEKRLFNVAAEMLKSIGVKSVKLLTNNPAKIKGLEANGISVEPADIHIKPKSHLVSEHLKAKASKLGHKITDKDWEAPQEPQTASNSA